MLEIHSHTESRNEVQPKDKPRLRINLESLYFVLFGVCLFCLFFCFFFSRFYLNAYKYPDIPSLSLSFSLFVHTIQLTIIKEKKKRYLFINKLFTFLTLLL